MFGTKLGAWKGQKIALYKTTTNGPSGQMVDCIRIRPQPPKRVQEQAAPIQDPDALEQAISGEEADQ
jgi:hypothetical protein